MRFYLIFLPLLFFACSNSSESDLSQILKGGSGPFQQRLANPKHEIQIVYGRIEEDTIIHEYFNVDPNKFFYPASTVKMLVAFAAAQMLSDFEMPLNSSIKIDSQKYRPRTLSYDSLYNGPITIENLLKKIFVFSDNQAYNILYEWLGKDYINMLHDSLGLNTRIIHKLSESAFSFSKESNHYSSTVELTSAVQDSELLNLGSAIYSVGEPQKWDSFLNPQNQVKGRGYIDSTGRIVREPFDFSEKNFITLSDLLGSLERVVKPNLFDPRQRYSYQQETYDDLMEIMLLRPRELPAPIDTLSDNYVKFFMYGDQEDGNYPEHIEIRNKVGWAYGYLTDIAYIRDRQKNIEFFLAATIHVNENEIYNDGEYEYEEVGLPFLAELGRLVYEFEASQK
ncbi:MAG: serine hydrolase [Cyclobacteriaceae bacterium]